MYYLYNFLPFRLLQQIHYYERDFRIQKILAELSSRDSARSDHFLVQLTILLTIKEIDNHTNS